MNDGGGEAWAGSGGELVMHVRSLVGVGPVSPLFGQRRIGFMEVSDCHRDNRLNSMRAVPCVPRFRRIFLRLLVQSIRHGNAIVEFFYNRFEYVSDDF